ncbi:MAG: hypothetical protein PVF07_13225, partial [Thiogranum sp.]
MTRALVKGSNPGGTGLYEQSPCWLQDTGSCAALSVTPVTPDAITPAAQGRRSRKRNQVIAKTRAGVR